MDNTSTLVTPHKQPNVTEVADELRKAAMQHLRLAMSTSEPSL